MGINETRKIGEHHTEDRIELVRHNRCADDTEGTPSIGTTLFGCGTFVMLTDEDRAELIDALEDPDSWPLRYDHGADPAEATPQRGRKSKRRDKQRQRSPVSADAAADSRRAGDADRVEGNDATTRRPDGRDELLRRIESMERLLSNAADMLGYLRMDTAEDQRTTDRMIELLRRGSKSPFTYDIEFNHGSIVSGKHRMDGANTLPEAARKLREYADHLDDLDDDGWRLNAPVSRDQGIMSRIGD